MEDLSGLLSQLSAKLGTTTEKMWGVLIKQATIAGWINIFEILGTFILCWVWWLMVVLINKKVKNRDWEEGMHLVSAGVGALLAILLIVAFFNIGSTITAFVNPEYWALDRILTAIKPSK